MCLQSGQRRLPCRVNKSCVVVCRMRLWHGCPAIGEWCGIMSGHCWIDVETTICMTPSTVDRCTSSPSELIRHLLSARYTWVVAIWQKTSFFFCPRTSSTNLGRSNFGLYMYILWCYWRARLDGHYSFLMSKKCLNSQYGLWPRAGALLRVGRSFYLLWRVATSRRRIGALFQHDWWLQIWILIR